MAQQFNIANPAFDVLPIRRQWANQRLLIRPAHDKRKQRLAFRCEAHVVGRHRLALVFIEPGFRGCRRRSRRGAVDFPGSRRVNGRAVSGHPRRNRAKDFQFLRIEHATVRQRKVEQQIAIATDDIDQQIDNGLR